MLGKGPSFAKRDSFDLGQYYTLSLNHAVREQPVTVAHMIDLDVVEDCRTVLHSNAEVVVLPWYPHVDKRPSSLALDELIEQNRTLRGLAEENKLLWYNLSTAKRRNGGSPVVQVRYFSAEAALNLLAQAGVCRVRSLGIDGGTEYSRDFADLRGKTLLASKHASFNFQFAEMAKSIFRTGIDYAPLDIESPIRVYVAATEAEMLPVKVLEFSIRKHASMSVQVTPLYLVGIDIPMPQSPHNRPRTPFSFQRFLIPQAAAYCGRAIYFDADMQVFQDIRELWTLPFKGADILAVQESTVTGRRPQFSVMLLNCEALRWDIREIVSHLDRGILSYEQLLYEMSVAGHVLRTIDPAWNCLERYSPGQTALLHYTDMPTQPWVSHENALGYLWVRDLLEAVDSGFLTKDYVVEQVEKGYVRPSLLYQLEKQIDDPLLLPKQARMLDNHFVAPYRSIHQHGASPWVSGKKGIKVALRHYYQKSLLYRLQRKWHNVLR